MNQNLRNSLLACLLPGLLALGACSDVSEAVPAAASQPPDSNQPDDVIARVGDEVITFGEINTAINSAAVVGLSIPTFGTPERDVVRLTLLDKLISADLIYLDALEKGLDRDPVYRGMVERFTDAELASLYRERFLARELAISDGEVEAFYRRSNQPDAELSDDMRTAITATLRKHKLQEQQSSLRAGLRAGVEVAITETALDPAQDATRADSTILVMIGDEALTWGEAQQQLSSLQSADTKDKRLDLLNNFVDYRLMVLKARAAQLDKDPVYKTRVGEFSKNRLINRHRRNLLASMEPAPEEIRAYYEENRDRIATPEMRKVQMVVVKTLEEAADIKQKIEAGELTLARAAAEFSTVPDAARNLGEIGWVGKDTGFPALDALTFSLAPGEIGGPVESPSGWHLVLVQDQRAPIHGSLDNEATRKEVRRQLLHERLDKYTVDLRLAGARVQIYEDVIGELARKEAQWFRELSAKSDQNQEALMEQLQGR